ncbi:hypothetical protein [Fusobacterium sp.]|uniref:hypothetical protein n=1 Tax=Fusobacterium sp. TaxID=68766 RepID=UPI002623555B|nr:hypothetical protein [Fusobacterium sp.]
MKKIIKAVLFLIVIVVSGILIFEYSYKLTLDNFITDRTTFIYSNKNINKEKLEKFENIFEIDKSIEKDILKRIKNICILSQSKLYSSDIKIVGIADAGIYYPIMYMKMKNYFNLKEDNFYELKEEYKKELKIPEVDNIYVKIHRGLFFVSSDTVSIDRILDNRGKKSLKTIEILNQNANEGLGTFVINQERERLFGIDRVVVSGNIEDNKILLDGYIYGDNEILKDLSNQPEKRMMNKYITDNRLYISTASIKKLDTFILRAISCKTTDTKKIDLIQELFLRGFADIISELNGEIVVDLENENYLLGLKSSKDAEIFMEYFKNDENINIQKDIYGNIYILIGGDTFDPSNNVEEIKENQFLLGKINTYYGKIEVNGFYDPDRLRIKTQINIEK